MDNDNPLELHEQSNVQIEDLNTQYSPPVTKPENEQDTTPITVSLAKNEEPAPSAVSLTKNEEPAPADVSLTKDNDFEPNAVSLTKEQSAKIEDIQENTPTGSFDVTPPQQQSGYNPPTGYAPRQQQNGYTPPTGYAPPQQQSGYTPPTGYAPPQRQSGYTPPMGYAPPSGYMRQPNYSGITNAYSYIYQRSPQELAQDDISKAAASSGALTLTIFFSMIFISIVVLIFGFFMGIIRDTPAIGNDPYIGFTQMGFYLYEGLISMISIAVPAMIIMIKARKTHNLHINDLIPFDKIGGKKLAAIVFGGIGICMIAQLMSVILSINFSIFGFDIEDAVSMEYGTTPVDLLMNTICVAFVPALVEELAYRGAVLGILKKYDTDVAIIGSAFLFGMLHGNLAQIPFAFVVGLVLAYVRTKTNSMLPNILIHFSNNFYAVLVTTLMQDATSDIMNMIDVGLMIILVAAAFFSIYYLSKNHPDFFTLNDKRCVLSNKEKFRAFFTSSPVIACTILLCIETVAVIKLI